MRVVPRFPFNSFSDAPPHLLFPGHTHNRGAPRDDHAPWGHMPCTAYPPAPLTPTPSPLCTADRETGRPRGFGFVTMPEAEARAAIAEMDGKDLGGRAIRVNEAAPPPAGGGRGGYGGERAALGQQARGFFLLGAPGCWMQLCACVDGPGI